MNRCNHINYTVIYMNENARNKGNDNKPKKDRYTAVLISQVAGLIIIMLVFNLFIKKDENACSQLLSYLNQELFTISDIAETIKDYFSTNNIWAVSGSNVTVISDEAASSDTETTTNAYETTEAMGGVDLKLYQAAENTSFSPIKSTSPAISPIENGRYTSYFGYRINPINGEFSFHTGLDIAADEDTKIRAVYNGRVLRTGEDDRAGKYIFLTHHDGYVTFYCHCSEIVAQEGAVIRQGETIARVGSTGWSTGPHLHFEVRKSGVRYNPLYILEK